MAKEYKREIKYAAGNMMQLHLRKYVDSSIEEVLDFFKDFPTLEELS